MNATVFPITAARLPLQHVPFINLASQHQVLQAELMDTLLRALAWTDPLECPNVRAFEAEFAAYCRTRYAIGVGSGSDALYLALRAFGIQAGDEVITVAFNSATAVTAITLLGAVPVFVDIDPVTYTLDPARLGAAIGPRTRAIVPVHLYGHLTDMPAITAIAQQHGLVVVEDASHAPGADDQGRRAGSLGEAAIFSFCFSSSLATYGDAGIITTNSRAVAEQVRRLRDQRPLDEHGRAELGLSSLLDELQAAVLRVKLRHLDDWNRRRTAWARVYDELLGDLDITLPSKRRGVQHVYHSYVIRADGRDVARKELADRGVATAVHYAVPLHLHAACKGVARLGGGLTVTEAVANQVLSLPIHAELSAEQVEYAGVCLRAYLCGG